jgi:hypothetical protein
MKEVKFLNLLKGISKKEFKEFKNFIVSPVFNNNENIISLYEYISKNYHDITEGNVSNREIYKGIFGNEQYNETRYWKITSAFAKQIDNYLTFMEYRKDKYYQKNILMEVYRSRNIKKQFAFLSREINKSFETEQDKGLNFLLNQTHYYFQNVSYLGTGSDNNLERDIHKLFENLRMFFIMINFTSISIISHLKKDYALKSLTDLWLFRDLIDYLNKNKTYVKKNYLTVYIFYLIILSKLHPEEDKYYFEVKNLIIKNIKKFSSNLLRHMFLNILNYSVSKLVKGDEKYLKEIFLINKIMDENSLTLFGEYIGGDYYYSVIEHSTMLKQISWAENFAGKYKIYLPAEYHESAVSLGLARMHFENKQFNLSLQCLLKVENINPYFYLSHKILLLQNHYELKDFDGITFLLETLSKYLKRRIDISNELKANYIKFIYYFRKLKTIATTKRYLVLKLEKEITNENFFLQKKWLEEKISLLK